VLVLDDSYLRLVAGTWYLSHFVRHPWDQLRPTNYSHPPFLRSHPCISCPRSRLLYSPSPVNMSSRKDHSVGYDHTLSSSVPDPTRAEKQVRTHLGEIGYLIGHLIFASLSLQSPPPTLTRRDAPYIDWALGKIQCWSRGRSRWPCARFTRGRSCAGGWRHYARISWAHCWN
jgi:hypothetical protein